MTLAERAAAATAVRARKADQRAAVCRELRASGARRKQVARALGISERTASRYLARSA